MLISKKAKVIFSFLSQRYRNETQRFEQKRTFFRTKPNGPRGGFKDTGVSSGLQIMYACISKRSRPWMSLLSPSGVGISVFGHSYFNSFCYVCSTRNHSQNTPTYIGKKLKIGFVRRFSTVLPRPMHLGPRVNLNKA
jgi:hypothetical protein